LETTKRAGAFKRPTSMWGKKKGVENEDEKDL
jgi:hypothetical protein